MSEQLFEMLIALFIAVFFLPLCLLGLLIIAILTEGLCQIAKTIKRKARRTRSR